MTNVNNFHRTIAGLADAVVTLGAAETLTKYTPPENWTIIGLSCRDVDGIVVTFESVKPAFPVCTVKAAGYSIIPVLAKSLSAVNIYAAGVELDVFLINLAN